VVSAGEANPHLVNVCVVAMYATKHRQLALKKIVATRLGSFRSYRNDHLAPIVNPSNHQQQSGAMPLEQQRCHLTLQAAIYQEYPQ